MPSSRYFTIREGNTNSAVYEGKLHQRVDKDIVSVSLPYGDWGLAPDMQVRVHRPADTKEPYHEAVIEHVFTDGIIQSKGKESNSVTFVKKEAVTPKMSDMELSLLGRANDSWFMVLGFCPRCRIWYLDTNVKIQSLPLFLLSLPLLSPSLSSPTSFSTSRTPFTLTRLWITCHFHVP